MSRHITEENGALKEVVVSMDSTYFTRLYRNIEVGRYGLVALIGENGVVRVRHRGDDESLGQSHSGSPLFEAIQAKGTGMVRTVSRIDGCERIYAYAHLDQYPIYAMVGIDATERLADFCQTRAQVIKLAVVMPLVLLVLVACLNLVSGRLIKSREQSVAANRANPAVPATLLCDRVTLLGVLHQLLDNAIRYTDVDEIELLIDTAASGILFEVRDTRRSNSVERQRRVLDKFTQKDDSPRGAAGGRCLGLAVAAKLVRSMGRVLAVQSELGEGARFFFCMPAARLHPKSASNLESTQQIA